MGVGVGLTGFLGFAKETTYGTPVPRTNFLEINSEAIETQEKVVESAALAQVGIRTTRRAQGAVSIAGSFDYDAAYSGWERLLTECMGSISSQQPDVTGSPTVWDHTISIADQLPTGLTFEVFRGTETFVTEPNKSFVYQGCQITQVQMSCKVDDLLKVQFQMFGQQEARQAKSTPVYPTDPLAVFTQGVCQWNANDVFAENFMITFNNDLEQRFKLGSRFTRQPTRRGKLSVEVSFDAEFTDWSQYDDFRNATQRQFIAQFIGPSIPGTPFFRQITMTIPIGIIIAHKVNLKQPGRLIMNITAKAYRDGLGTNELSVVFRNTTTASLVN
jgi:hypothetical protein